MRSVFKIIIFLMFSACYSKPEMLEHAELLRVTGGNEVFVINHKWHTGFIIEAKNIKAHVPQLNERFGDTPYLEFGWGDKDFYQAKEITLGLTLRAIIFPTESVIHAVAVPEKVNEYFPNSQIEKLCMSNVAFSSLITFISNSFFKNGQGKLVALKSGLYGNSQFYKGVGEFNLLNNCNKWTANGLKSTGMAISPAVKLTAGSVMNHIIKYKQKLTQGSNNHDVAEGYCYSAIE